MITSHLGPTLLLMGCHCLSASCFGSGRDLQRNPSVFERRLYGGNIIVPWQQYSGIFPCHAPYLSVYGKTWLAAFGGMTTLGTSGERRTWRYTWLCRSLCLQFPWQEPISDISAARWLEILQQDYLRTARAKGIGHFLVINKHALRNALVPIVTVIGMEIPVLFGGSIIVEQVFSWPGLGLMTMSAITNRDYPVIMGVCLLSAIVVLLGNLLTDILYAVVDPTIKLQ